MEYLLKEASKLEIPCKGVITNSYWAKSEKTACKQLNNLKKAGLTSLTFSVDFFHQEFIPLEYVRNAISSAVSIGFDTICVDSYFVEDVNSDNYFNLITKKNLEHLEQIEGVEFHQMPMSVEGRGTDLIQHIKLSEEIPFGKCPVPFWIDGDLENPQTIEIDCEGHITLCPGVCISNTQIQSLSDIIQGYDINKHPILSVIWKEGPIGLLRIVQEQGLQIDQQFANECHLCYEMRKFLHTNYPSFLAPKYCY